MNNLKPFNISKFNIPSLSDEEDIEISLYCYEKYNTTVTFSKNSLLTMNASEKLITKNRVTISIPEDLDLNVILGIRSKLDSYITILGKYHEGLNFTSKLSEDINFKLDLNSDIKLNAYLSSNNNIILNSIENLKLKEVKGSLNITFRDLKLDENLITNFNSEILFNLLTEIDTRLNKGQKLVIDSNNFTAYLDSENVLDKFQGNWINISRDIESIEIKSNGKIKGKIIFRERFL